MTFSRRSKQKFQTVVVAVVSLAVLFAFVQMWRANRAARARGNTMAASGGPALPFRMRDAHKADAAASKSKTAGKADGKTAPAVVAMTPAAKPAPNPIPLAAGPAPSSAAPAAGDSAAIKPHSTRTLSSIADARTFGPSVHSLDDALSRGRAAMSGGDPLSARRILASALVPDARDPTQRLIRDELGRIAEATLFSRAMIPGDTLTTNYRVQKSDTLASIARQFHVTDDLVTLINDLPNKNRIAVGRNLKVVNGPFNLRVQKSAFVADIVLGDAVIRSVPVGLGRNGSTPTGRWLVRDKLPNPSWTDPRSGEHYQPDDPDNPIGEYWIGLEGVEGDAVGKRGFGVHGTIEPGSIGKEQSLGCVRMAPADIEMVYRLMVPNDSAVQIVD